MNYNNQIHSFRWCRVYRDARSSTGTGPLMRAGVARSGRHSIGLSAAAYLEIEAVLRAGDDVRAVGALASIDDESWSALCVRFPHLPELIQKSETTR